MCGGPKSTTAAKSVVAKGGLHWNWEASAAEAAGRWGACAEAGCGMSQLEVLVRLLNT